MSPDGDVSDGLVVRAAGASRRSARLQDYLWSGPGADRASWLLRGGERWIVTSTSRSIGDELRRSVTTSSPSGRVIDRLEFLITAERFIERAADGRLLVDLPANLELDQPHEVFETGALRLHYCGTVEAAVAGQREELDAIALLAELEGTRRIQWLALGIGELALGSPGAGFDRWLTGWQGGDQSLFGGVS